MSRCRSRAAPACRTRQSSPRRVTTVRQRPAAPAHLPSSWRLQAQPAARPSSERGGLSGLCNQRSPNRLSSCHQRATQPVDPGAAEPPARYKPDAPRCGLYSDRCAQDRPMTIKHTIKTAAFLVISLILLVLHGVLVAQTPPTNQAARTGSLKQIIPGHYVYTTNNEGRLFNTGIVATNDGGLRFDALDTDAIARAERQAIADTIKQPVRYLVSSPFHDPFNGGSAVYADVFKIAHENYRAGLIDQMQRGNVPADVQRMRMPNATYRDRMTFYLGGKEIQVLHFGSAHTKGDSVLFVPQDRIAYLSEVFFNEEFPNMAGGYGVSWVRALDALKALDADIFIPGHGPIPDDPKQTRAALDRARQILVDARDGIQNEIARGATEDQAVAAVKLDQYSKLYAFMGQREVVLRRIYRELKGTLQ